MPGVWFTGPVPRPHDETNWNPGLTMDSPKGRIQDNVPEDGALVMVTKQGSVILTGCGHAGIVNIADDAQVLTHNAPVLAVIGGLHLFAKPDKIVDWTGEQLRQKGVKYLLAAHCTGIEATFRLRHVMGLTRKTCVVGATGAAYSLASGISAGDIAG
jgi:7,8-dihydropterin-6-yl-methyl-4-(beta-D-ribofuranosyl)aminobenzene 5'-phosphate synthase